MQEDNAFEKNLRARFVRELDAERRNKKESTKVPKKEKLDGKINEVEAGDGDTAMTDVEVHDRVLCFTGRR